MTARDILMAAAGAVVSGGGSSGGGSSGGGSSGGAVYNVVSGTRLPTLGTGGYSSLPAGWSLLYSGTADDSFVNVPLAANFSIAGASYNSVYVGSNTYLTFGSGSNVYSGLGAGNPALPKVMLGASDNSFQRVASYSSGTDFTRIRYEGSAGTSGAIGSPSIVYEATFFNASKFNGVPVLEILIGVHGRTGGVVSIGNAATFYKSSTLFSNYSYVLRGNTWDGTSWEIYPGSYISGVPY